MRKKTKLLVMAAVLLVAVAGGYLAITLTLPSVGEEEAVASERPRIGDFHMVEGIMVNPAGTKGARFLRASAALEVMNGAVAAELERRDVQIRDIMITELSAHTIAELMDPVTKEEIRQMITGRINELLTTGKLTNLYFLDYIIQ